MSRGFAGTVSVIAAVTLIALFVFACDSFEAAPDVAVVPDASNDAGSDASSEASDDAATATDSSGFCETFASDAGETIYCRDFDDDRAVLEGWGQTSVGPGMSLATDTTFFVSPPRSFKARLEPDAGDGCAYARAIRDVGPLRVVTRAAFDVRIGGDGANPAEGASYFVFDTGSCLMILGATSTRGDVHVQGAGFDSSLSMIDHFPRPGQWAHVEITIRAPTNRLEVTVEGNAALENGGVTLPAACITAESRITIIPGLHCEPLSASVREVRLDNLVVTGTQL